MGDEDVAVLVEAEACLDDRSLAPFSAIKEGGGIPEEHGEARQASFLCGNR